MSPMIPPPASWKPELRGTARSWRWYRAAGVNADGSEKTSSAHSCLRSAILRDSRDGTKTVGTAGERRRIPPPATWKPELIGEQRSHAWKFAGGVNADGSVKDHRWARAKIKRDANIKNITDKQELERTSEEVDFMEKVNSQKVRHNETNIIWKQIEGNTEKYKMKRKIARSLPVNKEAQKRYSALPSTMARARVCSRTPAQVERRRKYSSLETTKAKNRLRALTPAGREWRRAYRQTSKYKAALKVKNRKGRQRQNAWRNLAKNKAVAKARRSTPEFKAQSKIFQAQHRLKIHVKKAAVVERFILANQIEISEEKLSDGDAFKLVLHMISDKDSDIGKKLLDALGGKTLREAFWDKPSSSSMYISSTRGDGGVGGSAAESIRFTVNDPAPVLRHADDNRHFKFAQATSNTAFR